MTLGGAGASHIGTAPWAEATGASTKATAMVWSAVTLVKVYELAAPTDTPSTRISLTR